MRNTNRCKLRKSELTSAAFYLVAKLIDDKFIVVKPKHHCGGCAASVCNDCSKSTVNNLLVCNKCISNYILIKNWYSNKEYLSKIST